MSKPRKQLPLPDESSSYPSHKNRALPSLPSPDDAPPPPVPARPGGQRPPPPVPNAQKNNQQQDTDSDGESGADTDSSYEEMDKPRPGTPPRRYKGSGKGDHHDPTTPSPKPRKKRSIPPLPKPPPKKPPHVQNHQGLGRANTKSVTSEDEQEPGLYADAEEGDLYEAEVIPVQQNDSDQENYDEFEIVATTPEEKNFPAAHIQEMYDDFNEPHEEEEQQNYDDFEHEQQAYELEPPSPTPQPITEEMYEAVPEPPSKSVPSEAPRVPPARPPPSVPAPPPTPLHSDEQPGDQIYEPLPDCPEAESPTPPPPPTRRSDEQPDDQIYEPLPDCPEAESPTPPPPPTRRSDEQPDDQIYEPLPDCPEAESPTPPPPPTRKAEAKQVQRPLPKLKESAPVPKGRGMASGPALDLSAIMNKKGNLRKVGQPLERQNSDPKDIKDYGDTSELRNPFDIFRAREKETGGRVPPPLKKTPSSDSTGKSPNSPNLPLSPKSSADSKQPPKSIQRPKSSPPPPPIDRPPLPGNHPVPPPPTSSLPPPPVKKENYSQVNKPGKTELPPPPPEMNGNGDHNGDSDGEIYDEAFSKNDPMLVHDWYFGEIERDKGNQLLKTKSTDGTYLVRKSTRGGDNQPYTLMVMYNSHIYNLKIRIRNDTRFALGEEKSDEISFKSVEDLIAHHQKNDVILVHKSGQRYETVLKHIPKNV